MFIDPLCPECWALEPILKKLQIEYGQYFPIKHVLSGRSAIKFGKKKNFENIAKSGRKQQADQECHVMGVFGLRIQSILLTVSIALKAAELQGRRAGLRFLENSRRCIFRKTKYFENLRC